MIECMLRHWRFPIYCGIRVHREELFWVFAVRVWWRCPAIGDITISHECLYWGSFETESVFSMWRRHCQRSSHSFRLTHFAIEKGTRKNINWLSGGKFHYASSGECTMTTEADNLDSEETVCLRVSRDVMLCLWLQFFFCNSHNVINEINLVFVVIHGWHKFVCNKVRLFCSVWCFWLGCNYNWSWASGFDFSLWQKITASD